MTAAGVQNFETAYLSPPPSPSTPDTKAAGAADTGGNQADFQSELEMQDTGTRETKPAGQPKTGSGKPGKKKNTAADDPNASMVTPVQVTEPQKQVLPLVLAVAKPDENARTNEPAKPDDLVQPDNLVQPEKFAKMNESSQKPVQPGRQKPLLQVATGKRIDFKRSSELKQSAEPKQSEELKQSAELKQSLETRNPAPAPKAAASVAPDSPRTDILPPAAADVLVPEGTTQPADQSTKSAKPGASATSLPLSPVELKLPASSPEPAPTAIQETLDSAPSSPSELAFAARLAPDPQKADSPVGANPAQPPAVRGSQPADRIPMRYAAAAQILPSAGADISGPKRDVAAFTARSAWAEAGTEIRADVRTGIRTDIVAPRVEPLSPLTPASTPALPQPAAPPAHIQRMVDVQAPEPVAAPRTSAHDIRVRVPDNNGGSTQVRFVESGGEVRVSVRTADSGLAQNLRSHLNDLTQRLAEGGVPAEFWKPTPSAASSQNDHHQPDREGRGSGQQEPGGRNGQHDRQQHRPAWLEEMEASLHQEK